jgi:hypothetical protein
VGGGDLIALVYIGTGVAATGGVSNATIIGDLAPTIGQSAGA